MLAVAAETWAGYGLAIALLTFLASQLAGLRRRRGEAAITETWRRAAEAEQGLRRAAEAESAEREKALGRSEARIAELQELLKVEKARPDLSAVLEVIQAQAHSDVERYAEGMGLISQLFERQGHVLDAMRLTLEEIRRALVRHNTEEVR